MQTIIVDMTPGFRMPTIYYSQGDVGTQFAIDLRSRFGDSFPAGTTVTIQATKPSGFGFSVAATSVTNGVATFTTTAEMTDEFGRFPAELKVTKTGLTLFTANFYMDGERNTHPEGTTDGSQETVIPELTQLVERVEDAASSVLDMTVEAETLAAGSDATYSYDEETNTATFGIPKGADGSLASGVLAPTYSSSSTYAVGDYVYYSGSLYRCTTAITTAEAWTSGHWTQVALAPEVSDLKSEINDNKSDIATLETHKVNQPLDEYNQPTDGTAGQLLRTKGDGSTEWSDVGQPTDAQTAQAVSDWLDAHPEATTTVLDGSITEQKLNNAVKLKTTNYYVTPEMFGAVGDGVTDDTAAVRSALQEPCVRLDNTYKVTSQIEALSVDISGNGKIVSTSSFLLCDNDVVIRDIEIELTNDEASIGIVCKGACIIDNVTISKGLKGIQVNNNYKKCWITNSSFSNMYGDTARAVENLFSGETYFANNYVSDISNNLDRDADGVHFWQADTSNSYPCVIIQGNTFHNCRGRFIKASTANCEIRNNYCYNDDNYPVIPAFFAIDVQKGNSVVSNNYIENVITGIHIAFRYYATHHYISDNLFDGLNCNTSTGTGAIQFDSYDNTIKCIAVIERNVVLNYANRAFTLAYDLHTYILRDCVHHGLNTKTSIGFRRTANQTTRFEFYNCICDYSFFAIFDSVIPNAYAENSEVRCTVSQAIINSLPKTRYYATFTDGIVGSVGFRTIDIFSTSFLVELSTNSAHKIFNLSGQEL